MTLDNSTGHCGITSHKSRVVVEHSIYSTSTTHALPRTPKFGWYRLVAGLSTHPNELTVRPRDAHCCFLTKVWKSERKSTLTMVEILPIGKFPVVSLGAQIDTRLELHGI